MNDGAWLKQVLADAKRADAAQPGWAKPWTRCAADDQPFSEPYQTLLTDSIPSPAGHEPGPRVKAKFSPPESNQPPPESVGSRLEDNHPAIETGGLPSITPISLLPQPESQSVGLKP